MQYYVGKQFFHPRTSQFIEISFLTVKKVQFYIATFKSNFKEDAKLIQTSLKAFDEAVQKGIYTTK